MSSMPKRGEIKRFAKEVLRSRVDYASRGDLDFSKDDLVRAMDLEPSINIGHLRREMHLGMPGSEDFMTGESAAMDETVDRLANEGDDAVKTLPSTYSDSRPIIATGTKSARHLLQVTRSD
ncbi:hypothetical protein D1P53_001003 [Cryptococcus gattii VGV]|nr:hypothetical protein D1P53_001003 [Cryptococcus gattii VGV]